MRMLTLLLTGLSLATATVSATGIIVDGMEKRRYQCPENFIRLANSCYFLSVYMETWRDANFKCLEMHGSHLATPDRRWKDKRLKKLLSLGAAARLERWIGGIFNWGSHKWVWGVTGRPMRYQGFSRQSNNGTAWHCIAMDPVLSYRWKSETCLNHKHFICELPLRNIGAKPTDIYPKRRKGGKKGRQDRRRKKGRRKHNKEPNSIL